MNGSKILGSVKSGIICSIGGLIGVSLGAPFIEIASQSYAAGAIGGFIGGVLSQWWPKNQS